MKYSGGKKAAYKRWYDKNKAQGRAKSAAWRAANPARSQEYNFKETGFTAELFKIAMEMQGFCCAICRTPFADLPKRQAHADHDHLTGHPRGILCQKCNHGLGMFGDSPARLRAALSYLKESPL